MKKLLVVSCTQVRENNKKALKIYQSLEPMKAEVKLKIHFENTTGLPEVYNQYITPQTLAKHDVVLFAHDDLYVDDFKLRGKLQAAVKAFDIIGLAGCLNPTIKKPALWHLMSNSQDWRGYVAHPAGNSPSQIAMTSFGVTPARVAIVDGLFIAVNLASAIKADWKFNDSFTFHHYDIASCLDANKKHLKVGVAPINVIHNSPGLTNYEDQLYQQSEQKFLDSYGS
jgi:hypothetical protein